MIDRTEAARRGGKSKASKLQHPFCFIEHRVIDSPAFADLTFSARSLLFHLARQYDGTNNGHMQAAFSYLSRYGFDSDRTITRGIAELVSHGFVFRTRCGGFHAGPSRYALTWLPIKNRSGIFAEGFQQCAWRDWTPTKSEKPPSKMRTRSRKNGGLPDLTAAQKTATPPAKSADIEYLPCTTDEQRRKNRRRAPPTPLLAIRLKTTTDRGHLRLAA
ncbi:hypothetical protein [Rhodocyclus tenuis]|uniref:Helix-turn-helix domain-containing protein n=1 Tax=Rhodocyclus tenuis TaxID=1066 RepID=A0A840GDV2_RHOTE|nr:hypothetical protein [Rhodocyclus tenuis]MBB4249030.1 hypothetical protein [Rhodocyclus tenuis]